MRSLLLASLLISTFATPVSAQFSNSAFKPVIATLKLGHEKASPGALVKADVHFAIEKPWHIYWKNPGDAGLPTKITLELPEGYTQGDIEWPPHHTFTQPGNITGYGYEDQVVLSTSIQVPETAAPGDEVPVKAEVRWLACSDRCVPGKASFEKTISVTGALVQNGSDAPDFALKDQDGSLVELSGLRGQFVAIQWTNSGCPFVKRHYDSNTTNKLVTKWANQGVVFLGIDSSKFATVEGLKLTATERQLTYRLLEDSAGATGKAFGAKTTPHVFVIDRAGKIIYQGAMDDDPYGDKGDSAVNYMDRALTEASAGLPVTVSETKPYGCSVKYKE